MPNTADRDPARSAERQLGIANRRRIPAFRRRDGVQNCGLSTGQNQLTPLDQMVFAASVESADELERVILDPSFLLEQDSLEWLADPEVIPLVAVSAALIDRLREPDPLITWTEFGLEPSREQLSLLIEALEPVQKFSHRDRVDLSVEMGAIRERLLQDGPFGEVFADEWVFLATQSMGVLAADSRRTLDAFVRAGGRVYMLANEAVDIALSAVRSRLPSWLRTGMKWVGRFPRRNMSRILMFGGGVAALVVPVVGLPAAVVGLVQEGSAIIAGDPCNCNGGDR